MKNTDLFFEECIRETMDKNTEHIVASERLKNKVDSAIKIQEIKGGSPMKKLLSLKRVAITVAVLGFMMPVGAFAIGQISSYISSSSIIPDYWELPAAKELNEDIGFVPKAPESFANGYSFKSAHINNVKGEDDSGNVIEEFKGIDYVYVAADDSKITLSADNSQYPSSEDNANKPNAQTMDYKGIDLTYSEQQYKFVPPDYQLTPQDKKDEASGAVTFSYGSNQVETETFKFVRWSDEAINYLLMASDIDLGQDDFVEMAKEIIEQ